MGSNGLLRIGGTLGKSRHSHSEAHAVVVAKQRDISEATIRSCYENVSNGGRRITLNNLRQNGFWILKINAVLVGIIYRMCQLL